MGVHVALMYHSRGLAVGTKSDFLSPGGDAVIMSTMLYL